MDTNVLENLLLLCFTVIVLLIFVCTFQCSKLLEDAGKCKHKWDIGVKTNHYDISFGVKSYLYTTVRSRCEICGEYKVFKLKG